MNSSLLEMEELVEVEAFSGGQASRCRWRPIISPQLGSRLASQGLASGLGGTVVGTCLGGLGLGGVGRGSCWSSAAAAASRAACTPRLHKLRLQTCSTFSTCAWGLTPSPVPSARRPPLRWLRKMKVACHGEAGGGLLKPYIRLPIQHGLGDCAN